MLIDLNFTLQNSKYLFIMVYLPIKLDDFNELSNILIKMRTIRKFYEMSISRRTQCFFSDNGTLHVSGPSLFANLGFHKVNGFPQGFY